MTIFTSRVKIRQTKYDKGVPQIGCKDYSTKDSFETCLEERVKSVCYSKLSCVPLWFTDIKEEMCDSNINISISDQINLASFFTDIHVDNVNAFPSCPIPCNYLQVDTERVMDDKATINNSISIRLDQKIEVRLVKLGFDFLHGLLPSIGGDLGLTRNFLWLCITLATLLNISRRWISEKIHCTVY